MEAPSRAPPPARAYLAAVERAERAEAERDFFDAERMKAAEAHENLLARVAASADQAALHEAQEQGARWALDAADVIVARETGQAWLDDLDAAEVCRRAREGQR